ncbi:MAG: M16 family metallopeptidase [Candidatus Heimdallarchaeota archaeon]
MELSMVHPYDHFRTCTLGLVTKHGAANDLVGGTTTVLAQVMKRGSSRYSEPEVAKLIDGKGGVFFTAVEKDYSIFGCRVLPRYSDDVLDLLFDLISTPILNPMAFEIEREKLIQTVQQIKASSLQKMLFFDADRAIFGPNHLLGRSQFGDEESLSKIGIEDLSSTLSKFRENMFGFLVGNFNRTILSKVQQKFEEFSPRKLPISEQTKFPKRKNGKKVAVLSPVPSDQNAYLCLNVTTTATPLNVAMCRFSSALLGESYGSRMFRVLRDELGLGYITGSNMSVINDNLILRCFMETNPARVGEALGRLADLIVDLGRKPVSKREFETTKDFLINGLDLDFDSCLGITGKMINRRIHGLEESVESIYAEIQRVDPKELTLWWKDILAPENFSLAASGNINPSVLNEQWETEIEITIG